MDFTRWNEANTQREVILGDFIYKFHLLFIKENLDNDFFIYYYHNLIAKF